MREAAAFVARAAVDDGSMHPAVYGTQHQLQVVRVHASGIPATVMQIMPGRHRAVALCPVPLVGDCAFAASAGDAH